MLPLPAEQKTKVFLPMDAQHYIDTGIYVELPENKVDEYLINFNGEYITKIRVWILTHNVWDDGEHTVIWFGIGKIRFKYKKDATAFILTFGGKINEQA